MSKIYYKTIPEESDATWDTIFEELSIIFDKYFKDKEFYYSGSISYINDILYVDDDDDDTVYLSHVDDLLDLFGEVDGYISISKNENGVYVLNTIGMGVYLIEV